VATVTSDDGLADDRLADDDLVDDGLADGALVDDGPVVRVAVLGQVRAWRGETELELGAPQRRAVLGLLAARANQAVSRDELIDGIWGDELPARSVNALHVHVSRLRAALDPGRAHRTAGQVLQASGRGYLLRLAPGQLDAELFAGRLAAARESRRAGDPAGAAAMFESALRLWQGVALDGIPGPWAEIVRAGLGEQRLAATEEHIELLLELGRAAEAVGQLTELVRQHPLRERFSGQLMLALYRCGRQAEALTAFADARRVLVRELGIEPGQELRSLHARILAADPSLDAPASAPTAAAAPAGRPAGARDRPVPAQLPADVAAFTGRDEELAALDLLLIGVSRVTGASGVAGAAGAAGTAGMSGAAGTAGVVGSAGTAETAGMSGAGGRAGVVGSAGVAGMAGVAGPAGAAGMSDAAGMAGAVGQPGLGDGAAVPIAVLAGTAGVGKTALAVRWARRVAAAFPDGQLYVNLRGYDPGAPVPPGDALAGFLRALGLAGEDIPAGEDERAAAYRSLLDGRRMLVVLDNAASVEQARPLLPGSPSCLVVVTSRDSLAGLVARHGARRLALDMLPAADAIGLLRTLIGDRVDAEPDAAAELAAQCARLPLALRVAAELAAASPDSRLAELAGELAGEQRRLDLLDAGGDERTAVRGVFSWSYRHLPAAAARAFRLIGLHPGPDLDAYAVAALTSGVADGGSAPVTATQAKDALALLARAHLVHPVGAGRYGLHDLLRAYARELAAGEDGAGGQLAAMTSLFDYYLGVAGSAMDVLVPAERNYRPRLEPISTPAPDLTTPARARDWLDAERAVLVAVALHAAAHGWPSHATRLAAILYRYLETGGHYADALIVHGRANHAALLLGDRAAEAMALTNLGIISWRQGRYQQSADYHQQSLAASIAIGDRRGEATALANLGTVHERRGRYQQAAHCHQQALAAYKSVGERTGEARALGNLGSVAAREGHYERAVDWYQQALTVFRETGDLTGEASALPDLGRAYQRQGLFEKAVGCYQRALALFRETGDRTGEAEARNGVAEILLATGRPDEAQVAYTAALALAGQLGEAYEQARAHHGLAAALDAVGDVSLARHHRSCALELYSALGAPEADAIRAEPDQPSLTSQQELAGALTLTPASCWPGRTTG
jgi:DNA-binding SARP family transcriptional activator/tetratricopeptide (TPR) repeat protein